MSAAPPAGPAAGAQAQAGAAPAAAAADAAPGSAPAPAAAAPAAARKASEAKIAPGHVGNLNEVQTAALAKVKDWAAKNVKPFDEKDEMVHDDYFFTRFLRARKFDVPKAIVMLEKAIAYRRTHHLGQIIDCPPPKELHDLYKHTAPHAHHKFDKGGHPVYFMKVGKCNVEFLTSAVTLDDVLQAHHWDMEYHQHRCREQTKKGVAGNGRIETVLNVLDLDGIGTHTYGLLPYLKVMAKTDEDNYPETLEKTLIVNPPWIFNAIWAIVKPWLDPVVASKVVPLSGKDWKARLLEYIDADSLPVEYGGKCSCEGGCVPVYTAEQIKKLIADVDAKMELKELKIPAGKVHDLFFEVESASDAAPKQLEWYFKSVGHDQAFHIHITPKGQTKEKPIQPKTTVQSHKTVSKGKVLITEPGKVRFCFDNYSSWRTEKRVHYTLKVGAGVVYPKLETVPGADAGAAPGPEPSAPAAENSATRPPSNSTSASAAPAPAPSAGAAPEAAPKN